MSPRCPARDIISTGRRAIVSTVGDDSTGVIMGTWFGLGLRPVERAMLFSSLTLIALLALGLLI
jgi:hypothetical protein